jgi:hypothetical protein
VFRWLIDRRHRAFREDLSAYLDGQLSEREKRRLEEHLSLCAGCRRELDELRAVVEAVRSLAAAPVPRSFAIEPAAAPRPAAARRPSLALGALSAAALVVFAVLLGGDLLTQPGGGRAGEEAQSQAMAPVLQGATEGEGADEAGAAPAPEMAAPPAEAPAPTVAAPGAEAPAPTVAAPALALGSATPLPGEKEEMGVEASPLPAPEEQAPPFAGEVEGGSGRTALRALEVSFAVVFLAALAGAVWMRRRGGVR